MATTATVPIEMAGDGMEALTRSGTQDFPLWIDIIFLASLIPAGFVFIRIYNTGKWQFVLGVALIAVLLAHEKASLKVFVGVFILWLAVVAVGIAMVLASPRVPGGHRK